MKLLWIMGCGRSKAKQECSDSTGSFTNQKSQAKSDAEAKRGAHHTGNGSGPGAVSQTGTNSQTTAPAPGSTDLKSSRSRSEHSDARNGDTGSSISEMGKKFPAEKGKKMDETGGMIHSEMRATGSQVEFFRLLDEKIAKGKDYDPMVET